MKRMLAVAVLVAVAFAVVEFVGATGSDGSLQETSRKSMGVIRYDEADVRLDSGVADTTSWIEASSYVNCVTCWLVGDIAGDSSHVKVYLQVRNRDHTKAVFLLDSNITACLNDTTYICKQWTWFKPVKEFRFIRTNMVSGALGDSAWCAEFRTYLGQE